MLAPSIRQPYAELMLRGMKTIEYRGKKTSKLQRRAREKTSAPIVLLRQG